VTTPVLVAAAVFALVDWWAVAGDRRPVELVAKPATMALLVALASTAGSVDGDVRLWLVVGAVLGVVGDVALLGDGEAACMGGLGSFALGHVAYVLAATSIGFDAARAVPGIVFVAGLLGYRFVGRTLPGANDHGGTVLAVAVGCYAVVISAMVVTAWATGRWLAGAGASMFAVSDWVLGYQRFVGPLPGRRLSVMIPYHVGQAVLILGLASA
jgi:uncharacterized membrane protein YhhN